MGVADLERERGGEFWFEFDGEQYRLADPADLEWPIIVAAVRDILTFIVLVADGQSMSTRQAERLRDSWIAHYGLGGSNQIARLEFLLDRYHAEIEADLLAEYPGTRLGDLWHSRRVRELLNLIDRLPGDTYTNAAIAQDEEHIKLMVEAGLKPSKGVSQVGYSPEVARLDAAIDAMHRVGDILIQANSSKGRRTPPTRPQPRPKSAFARVRHETRMAQHRELTARLLPNGPQPESPRPRVAGERRRDRRVLDGTAVVAPGSGSTFIGKADATREEERRSRWADRAREVGRVPQSSDPAT